MHPDNQTQTNKHSIGSKAIPDKSVHLILAYSYLFYFTTLLVGVLFDFLYPHRFFQTSVMAPVGFVLLFLSTLLILWAQRTSRSYKKETVCKEIFCNGPYSFTRIPTHLGLFLMVLGFGMIINATFVILFSIVSFFATKFFFLRKEELILADKYSDSYLEYKKLVRF